MDIRLNVTEAQMQTMTVAEYEAIERAQEGDVKIYRLRPLVARFMTDEDGAPLSHDAAMAQLGKLSLPEFGEVVTAFRQAMEQAALPKANGPS